MIDRTRVLRNIIRELVHARARTVLLDAAGIAVTRIARVSSNILSKIRM
jgi:hypothetical protein